MFIHFNGRIWNADLIKMVDCNDYLKDGSIVIHFTHTHDFKVVKGVEALNIIQTLCPSVLEGKRAKYVKNAWAVHNLIGHPLMQIFSWLKLPALGIRIHDATIPEPVITDDNE